MFITSVVNFPHQIGSTLLRGTSDVKLWLVVLTSKPKEGITSIGFLTIEMHFYAENFLAPKGDSIGQCVLVTQQRFSCATVSSPARLPAMT